MAAPGVSFAARGIDAWAHGRTVWIALDADAAGQRALVSTAREVRRHGGTPFRVRWPEGTKDANDVLRAVGPVAFAIQLETLAHEGTL